MSEILKIALCGKMRSGKDSVAWRLFYEHGFEVPMSFGASLKRIAHEIFPDVPKEPKPRALYQFMNVMRDYDPDVWVKHLASSVEMAEDRRSTSGIVVTDARQANEVAWLRENGFIIVKVEAGEVDRVERIKRAGETVTDEALRHATEQYVDDIEADYTIPNFGTLDELYAKIDGLVGELKAGS